MHMLGKWVKVKSPPNKSFYSSRSFLIGTTLFPALITFLIYLPALQNGFVNWDDPIYVYQNQHLQATDSSILKWTLSSIFVGNWHPLTMLSYTFDYAVWELDPFGYHLTNIILHTLNTFLVFVLVSRLIECGLTQNSKFKIQNFQLLAASITALLFGIHPLHVESVAWVSERKDILCAFFFLSCLLSYINYVSTRGLKSYLFSLLFFVLALLSKPMAVSLPVVLLIFDYYPCQRLELKGGLRNAGWVFAEKMPFILFAVLFSVVTIIVQQAEGALTTSDMTPPFSRLLTPAHSFIFYLSKMLFPFNLAPIYPPPLSISLFNIEYILTFIIFLTVTALSIFSLKKDGLFAAIWFYYIVTLLPVIGIVPAGFQIAADRYTYLPSIGPFLLIGLGAAYLMKFLQARPVRTTAIICILLISFIMVYRTISQTAIWHDSISLWSHEIRLFPETAYSAYNNRGLAYKQSGNYRPAINDFDTLIKLNPEIKSAYLNRGNIYNGWGNYTQAASDYTRAIQLDSQYTTAYFQRASAYSYIGEIQKAISDYSKVIELNPRNAEAYNSRGIIYAKSGNYQDAITDFSHAVELDPLHADAYYNLGLAHQQLGSGEKTLVYFNKAAELDQKAKH